MIILKERIQHEVCLFKLKSPKNAFSLARKVEIKNMDTIKFVTNNYREIIFPLSSKQG